MSSAYWWYAASVPAAPPSETGSAARVRRTRSTASSTRCSQVAAFSPKVTGTACWVRVRPAIGVSRCRSASPARLSAHEQQVVCNAVQCRRAQQHQRRVQDVLAGAAAVHVLGGGRVDGPDRGRELLDERHHGVGRLPHSRSHHREVDASGHGGGPDGRRRARRNHAQLGLRLGQRDFRGEHGCQQRVVVNEVSRSRRRPRGRQNSVVRPAHASAPPRSGPRSSLAAILTRGRLRMVMPISRSVGRCDRRRAAAVADAPPRCSDRTGRWRPHHRGSRS